MDPKKIREQAFKKKNSKRKNTLEIDIGKILGKTRGISLEDKEDVAFSVIDRIIERTRSGRDVDGKKFKLLSKKYAEFKGKGTRNSDLTLDGDMLEELDIVNIKGNKVVIGWDDPDQQPKIYNHEVGDTLKKREFLGLTEADVKRLLKEFNNG